MFRILSGSTQAQPDTEAFLRLLNQSPEKIKNFFSSAQPLIVTRAPGRLDLMGGIADYSGSLVLQLPIAQATHAALQIQAGDELKIISLAANVTQPARTFAMKLADSLADGKPISYAACHEKFKHNPDHQWVAYIAGAFLVLLRERGIKFTQGAAILIYSDVPEGKGVSSSAALEVAVMQAIVAAYKLKITPPEIALLCQKVENLIAGAPCGVMDQMTSVLGERNELLALLCQPAEIQGTIKLPDELSVWGIDSGIRHSVGGADYGTVRTAAFMGYRMIADIAGCAVTKANSAGKVVIEDKKWHGYLANILTGEFQKSYAAVLPEKLSGAEFLARYDGITDPVTAVNPDVIYPVLAATKHPIYEHARVKLFAEILQNWQDENQARQLGNLMYQSHESYSTCGLGSPGTDEIVRLVREAGEDSGLFGAKITGGGSGGTVAVLGHKDAAAAVQAVAEKYAKSTGHQPLILSGSSVGAKTFGSLLISDDPAAWR